MPTCNEISARMGGGSPRRGPRGLPALAVPTAIAALIASIPDSGGEPGGEPGGGGEAPAPGPPRQGLRIMAYNIHHGEGVDGKVDLERLAKVIEAQRPDLVALQEVDERCGRSGRVDQAAWFAKRLGLHQAFGAFMDFDGGRYGMAVLSRFPILEQRDLPLPPGGEPRIALEVEVEVDGQRLSFVGIHFDWIDDDRVRFSQAKALVRTLAGRPHPVILAGDFNDRPGSRTLDLIGEGWSAVPKKGRPATWPSAAPRIEIDHVFVRGPSKPVPGTATVPGEMLASDHRPVFALLPWPAGVGIPSPAGSRSD